MKLLLLLRLVVKMGVIVLRMVVVRVVRRRGRRSVGVIGHRRV